MIFKRSLCILISALPIFSWANWQWTKWGMSVDEVAAASGGKAARYEGPDIPRAEQRTLLRAPYSAQGMEFTVSFGFNKSSGGLSLVELSPDTANLQRCVELEQRMKDVYGQPLEESMVSKIIGLKVMKWRDEKGGNRVLMTISDDSCGLQYTPAIEREGSGL